MVALQSNDFVTSVVPLVENGEEVGYKITFSKSGTAYIYHGKDGTNGQDGKDGTDGVTPKLRINTSTNFWEVSYDDGSTWNSLGIKATGEQGPQGEPGQPGTTGPQGPAGPAGSYGAGFFNSVSVDNDGGTITFVLADGTSVVLPYGDRPIRFESELPQTITSTSQTVVVIINCDVDDIVSLSASLDAQDAVYTRAAGGWRASLSVNKTAKRATISVTPDTSIEDVLLTVTAVLDGGATHRISKILTAESGSGGGSGGGGGGGEVDPPTPPGPGVTPSYPTNPDNANCHIVSSAGTYSFPTVYGNSDTSVGAVASAEVLWESFGTSTAPNVGDLVSNVSYSGGRITYTATGRKGNAVIAAKDA